MSEHRNNSVPSASRRKISYVAAGEWERNALFVCAGKYFVLVMVSTGVYEYVYVCVC